METARAQDRHLESLSPRARFFVSNSQQTLKPYARISFVIGEMRSRSKILGIALMTWSIAPILASLASMSSCGDGIRRSGATCAAQIPSSLTGSKSHATTRHQSAALNEAHRHELRSHEMVAANQRERSLCLLSSPGVRQSASRLESRSYCVLMSARGRTNIRLIRLISNKGTHFAEGNRASILARSLAHMG